MKHKYPLIVVAQTHQDVLEAICERRDSKSKNRVLYTANPGEVLSIVHAKPVDVVVAGQRFYQSDIHSLGDFFGLFSEVARDGDEALSRHYQPPVSGPCDGSELSEIIYHMNPKILVFRYSLTPSARGKFVGDIPKEGGRNGLLQFLDSPDLGRILKSRDWKAMRETYPFIKFYEGWEEEHLKGQRKKRIAKVEDY